jgi:hypothetical protein
MDGVTGVIAPLPQYVYDYSSHALHRSYCFVLPVTRIIDAIAADGDLIPKFSRLGQNGDALAPKLSAPDVIEAHLIVPEG